MSRHQRALVTGATGFVGSHLVRRLVDDGWHVECVVRPESDCAALPVEAVRRISDGSTCGLAHIMTRAAPDVVFHLASLFVSEHVPEQVEPLVVSNVLFGAQLLEAMTLAGVGSLVNTGTAWQHYQGSAYEPVNLYAATKQALEAIARYYVSARGLRMVTLELTDTYGPDDHRAKLFTLLRRASIRGERLVMSAGEQLIDLVYVDDVVEAFLLAAETVTEAPSQFMQSFTVSGDAPLSLRALVERYASVTDRRIDVDWGGRPYRQREVMTPPTCTPRIGAWRPCVGLDEGIRRMERLSQDELGR